MIVNGKRKTDSTASIALEIFLNIKPCYDSFTKLKNKLTVHSGDSKQIVRGKMLLLAMISSAEQMFYHEPCKKKRNYDVSLTDVQFMIFDALLEITECSLLPNFEIPPTPDTFRKHTFLKETEVGKLERCTC